MEYITLEESTNLLKLGIKTKDGKDTGEILEFNFKEIELIDKLQKMREETKKNRQWIDNQFVIIEKKQDFTKKGQFMTNNEKMKYDALKTYFNKQKEIYNMFLGERGVEKLLYGKPLEWESLRIIDKIIEEQIIPKVNISMNNILKEIKEKYTVNKKESVLE